MHLVVTIRFLTDRYHGRTKNGRAPEWPPSPMRVFQAIVAGAAPRWWDLNLQEKESAAFKWLEGLDAPQIVAPIAETGRPVLWYVRENLSDVNREKRDVKLLRPTLLKSDAVVKYSWEIDAGDIDHAKTIVHCVRHSRALGWGIDMVVGDGNVTDRPPEAGTGEYWHPTSSASVVQLRVPTKGTFNALETRHRESLQRMSVEGRDHVSPLRAGFDFDMVGYRRDDEALQRPYRVFELRSPDGSRFRYPQSRLIHIAGMVRHLAIEAMKACPPTGLGSAWVESYVAGHAAANAPQHRQLSYLPLPSIGYVHTDPGVRRVMIVAPLGDDAWLDHVARHLAGRMLEPVCGDEFAGRAPPLLVPVRHDNMARMYTQPANAWASVTPVILPGHDDHKSEKTRKLIEKALAQSGIEQPCEFEWSASSRFPKSLSAHKYDRDGRLTGYIRPDHLQTQTAVHLTLRFKNDLRVPGPLAIGAGRHCGLGVFAPCT